ncbi:MAG: hypothetical protein COB85_08770 [Bacteroidetes bacterium]|nr:MAG: hypothetical protein COB85_08770 [Bacteroidota bacterium]
MKSRNIFYIYLITGSILFLNSCIAYKYSHKSKGEEVYVEIIHFSDENNSFPVNSVMEAKNKTRTRGVLPLIAAPYAINMAVRGVSKVVASERKKYAAVYSAKNSDDMFYTDNTSKAGINIEEIRFVRLVKGKKQKMDTALVLGLGAELSSDGNFIRLVPKRLDVSYSKTKLKLGDKKFDLDLNVTINAYWLDPNKSGDALTDMTQKYKQAVIDKISDLKTRETELTAKYNNVQREKARATSKASSTTRASPSKHNIRVEDECV